MSRPQSGGCIDDRDRGLNSEAPDLFPPMKLSWWNWLPRALFVSMAFQSYLLMTPTGDAKMKKILMAMVLSSGLFVAACNTVEGAGRDVQSVGECADGKPGNC